MSTLTVLASPADVYSAEEGSLNVRELNHATNKIHQKRAEKGGKKAKVDENGDNNGGGNGNGDNLNVNPTQAGLPVKGAKGKLEPDAALQANKPEPGAKKAFTAVQLKLQGKCVFVDPLGGDFRQELIPARLVECDGTNSQKFNLETSGKHIDDTSGKVVLIRSVLVCTLSGFLAFQAPMCQASLFDGTH